MTKIKCFMVERVDGPGHDWRNVETGEIYKGHASKPVGAMWDAHWYRDEDGNSVSHVIGVRDGQTLMVKTPGGDWCIDQRASNCTAPKERQGEGEGEHFCWVRHGVAPNITVDKNGKTCKAGAGSIGVGNYHGFLRDGYLT